MQQRLLELDGGGLAYRTAGDGPLVVFHHAIGPVAWGDLAPLTESCTAVVLDWEASTLEREPRVTYAWFEPLVRASGRERATLCAWSMAGPGAILFAAEEPPAMSSLILLDVAGLSDDMPPLRLRDLPHFFAMRVLGRPTRGFVRMLWRGWVWKEGLDTRELEAATLRFFRANPDAFGMSGDDDEDEDEEELIDELPSIAVPTLVLAGRHSQVLGPEHGRTAAERLPKGELVVFERSGHSLQLEEPKRFQSVVAEFVTRVGSPTPAD